MNNGRLFLFCIGGTGSRVLRSLIFLMASGVKINAREIIPIIIDPDRDNGDVERTLRLLRYYRNTRAKAHTDKTDFFGANIQPLSGIGERDVNAQVSDGFRANIVSGNPADTHGQTFRSFLEFDSLDNETKSLIQLLYTEDKNLESDLTVGFKGNPHMGSVVLNRLTDSQDFQYFVHNVTSEDRVFIVSSIFGGTGAAGFPLLVKNIRQPDAQFTGKQDVLKNIPLGAISVLPYFGVKPNPNSAIDKNTFITKTKAALSHYDSVLAGLNALYYIGDDVQKDYENVEGAAAQANDAHFVEVAGALAIIDFMDYSKDDLRTGTKYKEYGTQQGTSLSVDFKQLGTKSRLTLGKPLVQFFYAWKHWQHRLPQAVNEPHCVYTKGNPKTNSLQLTANLLSSDFFSNNLRMLCQEFETWLQQLAGNQVAFAPFNLNTAELQQMLQNIQQKAKGFAFFKSDKWDYKDFDSALDAAETQMGGFTAEQKLLALYAIATDDIYQDRIVDAMR
jgi:hypothetical protein